VEEQISTTLIPEGFAGTVDQYRNIILEGTEQRLPQTWQVKAGS